MGDGRRRRRLRAAFGHSASYQCPDKSKWLSRAPPDCKRQAESIPSGKPAFVPKQTWAQYPPHENLTLQDEISVPCWHCSTTLSFPRLAPKDCSVLCPTCSLQNHPSSSPSPSRSLRLKLALPTRPDRRLPPRPTSPLQRIQESARYSPAPAPPSAAVLPLWNWPQTQPSSCPLSCTSASTTSRRT